jgi:three-Cys-motif partner protein
MPASSDFFGQRNAQAVLKHGVLTRYAHYFAGRAGSATKGRVAFIDGYAGEGRYQDGSPGSPLLLASQATRAQMFGRDVKLAFVEQDDARREQLRQSLSENSVEPDQLLGDSLETVIDGLLDRYAQHAVLLFVDPFGLAVSRSTLERVLRRRSRQQPIDVLYHFSLSTVARMGRAGVVEGPTALLNAEQLDGALGDIGWRDDFERATAPNVPTEAAVAMARRFGESVHLATSIRSTAVPVRQRPAHLPRYLLMLFSGDQKAHWDFADLASKAHVDWLYHCDREDYEANVRFREEQGLIELFASPEPNMKDIDEQLHRDALAYLPDHLAGLLRGRRSLRPLDDVEAVYGEMLGRARVTHVRAAINELHDSGSLDAGAGGDFWLRTFRWTGP